MNQILDDCRCNKKVPTKKKRKSVKRREGKSLEYPKLNEITFKTFRIKYNKKLSSTTKFILNSFQNKYIYYAIDDILDLLKLNSTESQDLLAILYSPIISLQNNSSINFFDIWIHEIYINEKLENNKFFNNDCLNFENSNYIIIKFLYKPKLSFKKTDSLW